MLNLFKNLAKKVRRYPFNVAHFSSIFWCLGLNSFHNFEKGTINQQYKSAKFHPCTAKEDFGIPSPQPAQGSVIHAKDKLEDMDISLHLCAAHMGPTHQT